MEPRFILLVTTTFYKSTGELRFELALETVKRAREEGHRVLIIDGSPDSKIRSAFHEYGARVILQKEQGIGPIRRQLFDEAFSWHDGLIFWTEPEKSDLVRFIPDIVRPIIEDRCDISIPVRSERSWQSYPKFQRESEATANLVYKESTGIEADPMFGPVAINQRALPYFASCRPGEFDVGDNYIQHVAPLVAVLEGNAKILSPGVEVDFQYPSAQREEEDGPLFRQMVEKRLWQLRELTETYLKFGRLLGNIHNHSTPVL